MSFSEMLAIERTEPEHVDMFAHAVQPGIVRTILLAITAIDLVAYLPGTYQGVEP